MTVKLLDGATFVVTVFALEHKPFEIDCVDPDIVSVGVPVEYVPQDAPNA